MDAWRLRMSDFYLVLVPEDPRSVPTKSALKKAVSLLEEYAEEVEEIDVKEGEGVQFFDCGENFEKVVCPRCKATIDQDWAGRSDGTGL
jgi:hypothetical protein